MSKFFINCEEASHICDKSQYKEASFFERIKLTMHLLYCKVCRKYTKQNAKLTDCVKKSNVKCMDNSAKEAIKANVEKELSNHQH